MPSPTNEPAVLVAGDSVSWVIYFSDYLAADGWSLAYGATGPSNFAFQAGVLPPGFQVQLGAGDTALWKPGKYLLTAFVSRNNGAERVTLYHVPLTVLPNPTAAALTTHAQRCLKLIEDALEGRIPRGIEEQTIDGQHIAKMSIEQLHAMRDKYRREVMAEQAALASAAGVKRRKTISVRFVG